MQLVFSKDKKLWIVDLEGPKASQPRQLASELGTLAPFPLWWLRDGQAVLVGVDPIDDQEDFTAERPQKLAVVPLEKGPIALHPIESKWVYRGVLRADSTTIWQPRADSIQLLLEERSSGETAVVRLHLESGETRVLWQGLARFRGLTGGGRHDGIAAIYEDVGTAPNVYWFDSDFRDRRRISHVEPRLDEVSIGTVEMIEGIAPLYNGELGQVRTAILLPPGAERGDRLPAIVIVYPGANTTRTASRFGGGSSVTVPTLLFTSRRYAVVLPHLLLGPDREPGQPAQEMVDVLLPQVYRAAELGYIDLERIAVMGQSFGGYGTAALLTRTNIFRAGIAISGVYDLSGTYGHLRSDKTSLWISWAERGQARMGNHPWANLKRYIDNSPYYQADKIRAALLLVHGDEDRAYHDAEKLFSALRRLGRDAQLAIYAGQGHVISRWTKPNAIDACERMIDFLNRHLKNEDKSS